jgi:pyruvate/2-oxoglutarate dehydrogenase complex dihydrolipoamide dehydrogenase (E3) component
MTASEMTDTYDVVVIGGGPPGENVANYAIKGSNRTAAIVEYELVGGECSYWACMPSKALLRPADVLAAAKAMPGVREIVGDSRLDVAAVLARRDEFTHHRDDSPQVDWATGVGVDIVRGRGRLAGERNVEVVDATGTVVRTLRAREAVVLSTGTTAAIPPVPGLREAQPWTSRDVTNLRVVPRRVAVLGGGVVACESATWLRALGVEELTIIERGPALLGKNEPFAGDLVRRHFERSGVTVHTDASVTQVRRADPADTGYGEIHGGPVEITVDGVTITVDEIVVAAGRTPASADLGLNNVGLEAAVNANHGFVAVDDHFSVTGVSGEWLYAIGDLTGRALLTHMGKYQARIAGWVIAARAEGRPLNGPRFSDQADHDQVPQVTFTDPEVASVGLTENAARDQGIAVETVEYDLAALAGTALLRDDYEGRAKLVIDTASDLIVGATFVGPEVAELVHAATIAIVGRVPMEMLWHAVPSYPTASEIWLRLLEARES